MTASYEQANDEMVARVQDTWDAATALIVGDECPLYYPGIVEPDKPPVTLYWARMSRQTVREPQTTLRNGDDKRYTSYGLIFIQLFAPMTDATAAEKLRLLSELVRNGFRAGPTPSEVKFENMRINELNNDGKSLRCNVVTEYNYDEIG
jgi:hypothetical protein